MDALVSMALAGIGGLIWFARLEGEVRALKDVIVAQAQTIRTLTDGHGQLQVKVAEELGRIRESLARIEGRLGDVE